MTATQTMPAISIKRVVARVTMTVEVECNSNWSGGTTADQIHDQAVDDARGALRRGLILDYTKSSNDAKTHGRIIGEPKVTTVIVEEQRS